MGVVGGGEFVREHGQGPAVGDGVVQADDEGVFGVGVV